MAYFLGVLTGLVVSFVFWGVVWAPRYEVMLRDLEDRLSQAYAAAGAGKYRRILPLEKPETPPAWEERS